MPPADGPPDFPALMKLSTRYEQTSCRLVLEGLPDLSAGQGSDTLGILMGFTLALAGRTELEGQRDHLQALIAAVMPYARHLLSGQPRPFGAASDAVAIAPLEGGHQLELVQLDLFALAVIVPLPAQHLELRSQLLDELTGQHGDACEPRVGSLELVSQQSDSHTRRPPLLTALLPTGSLICEKRAQ